MLEKQTVLKHSEITDKILHAFYKVVYPQLGYGFLEKAYENAMLIELSKLGLKTDRQKNISIYYNGFIIGDYYADIIIENLIICELKARDSLGEADEKQLVNYLRSTNIEVGLLLNFGKKPEIKRKIFDNDKKSWTTSRITRFE